MADLTKEEMAKFALLAGMPQGALEAVMTIDATIAHGNIRKLTVSKQLINLPQTCVHSISLL